MVEVGGDISKRGTNQLLGVTSDIFMRDAGSTDICSKEGQLVTDKSKVQIKLLILARVVSKKLRVSKIRM